MMGEKKLVLNNGGNIWQHALDIEHEPLNILTALDVIIDHVRHKKEIIGKNFNYVFLAQERFIQNFIKEKRIMESVQ